MLNGKKIVNKPADQEGEGRDSIRSSDNSLNILKKSSALLYGHFLLTSGLHSNRYFQCALVLQHPRYAEHLAKMLAGKFKGKKPDVVVSPAIGGIVLGQELGRVLGIRAIFAEREEGKLTLRRGFDIKKSEKAIIVEDVLTTGGSVREIVKIVTKKGADLVGIGCIVNRSSRPLKFKVPVRHVLKMKVNNYDPQECPLCKKGIPVVKPGSRKFSKNSIK